jgi:hypothetical protein
MRGNVKFPTFFRHRFNSNILYGIDRKINYQNNYSGNNIKPNGYIFLNIIKWKKCLCFFICLSWSAFATVDEHLFNKLPSNANYGIYLKDEKAGYINISFKKTNEYFLVKSQMTMFIQKGRKKTWALRTLEERFSLNEPYKLFADRTITKGSYGRWKILCEMVQDGSYRILQVYRGGSKSMVASIPSQTLNDKFKVEFDCIQGVQEGHENKFVLWNRNSLKDETYTYKFEKIEKKNIINVP